MGFSGSLAQVRTNGTQCDDMDVVVGLLQQMGNVMEAAGVFEATDRAGKAQRPVLALRAEQVGAWGTGVQGLGLGSRV